MDSVLDPRSNSEPYERKQVLSYSWIIFMIFVSLNSASGFETDRNYVLHAKHKYSHRSKMLPVVVNTWPFTNATAKAWETVYDKKGTALDAVEKGCTACEEEQCDGTVGYGGSPDENGETTLDAMIMDGTTMNMGAVAALRRIKKAISVARHVLHYTDHSMLAGSQATEFAVRMGFKEESLQTEISRDMWRKWKGQNCQPNFWMNVSPDPRSNCGPYTPNPTTSVTSKATNNVFDDKNHDTIGMVVIDRDGHIAAGTSTNGAKHKIPGFVAVEEMRRGSTPQKAAEAAIHRIIPHYPNFSGAVVTIHKDGEYAAACHGMDEFKYSVCNPTLGEVTVHSVPCLKTK
ncbi:N(4)-(Beta-N-acetylglucosaminyl)-L-asparaginase [Gryllus bimaculatus]|nr:N(4)-(Beta-N-acetylglucosaminyl)-L-asparaginase [Gryllus bimaculatus]